MSNDVSVAVIGVGSRGLGVLERIVTLTAGRPDRRVAVELIDPTGTGAGVHAVDQPDYLLLNTTCAQVSLFPDSASVGEATGEPGPTLYDWVAARGLRIADDGWTVGPVGRAVRPHDFLPRRLLGQYLHWFLDQLRARAAGHVTIRLHRTEAVRLDDEPGGGIRVRLADGGSVVVRHVFLTTGYTANDRSTDGPPGLIATPYPLPDRLAPVGAGQTVAVSGLGLTAMDVMSCLTVGRGGRFTEQFGGLTYHPSGAEPRMLFFSRSGQPCRARPKRVEFGEPYRPLLFTPAAIDALRDRRGPGLDFDRDVLSLVCNEMRLGHRRCRARLDGTSARLERQLSTLDGPAAVLALLDELDAGGDAFDAAAALVGSGDPHPQSGETYQKWFLDTIRADLAEGLLGFDGSPVKAGLDVLRALRDTFRYAVDFGGLTPDSLEAFTRHTIPALNRAVVGPQYERHAELIALLDAGIAEVPLGPAPDVRRDAGHWTLSSTALEEPVRRDAEWLVRAHVDLPCVRESANPLLRSLHRAGRLRRYRPDSHVVTGVDIDRDQHPVDVHGRADTRIWVLGPLCEGATFYNNLVPSPGVRSRPIVDAHRCVSELLRG